LLALGEDDPVERVIELARTLLAISRFERVDVLVRANGQDLSGLEELAEANPERMELAREPAEVSARVARCHLAVGSGGGLSLELACVGVPQLVIADNECHMQTARRLEEEGAAVCVSGNEGASAASVRHAVQELLNDPLERQAMSRCARKLIDGRGPDRLVTALEVMLHPSRHVDLSEAA
jgi:spore coat polysaccharide biosynthesis predicted glycosyltransferase SpsG